MALATSRLSLSLSRKLCNSAGSRNARALTFSASAPCNAARAAFALSRLLIFEPSGFRMLGVWHHTGALGLERVNQRGVFRGVAEVLLPADDVGHAPWFDVVDDHGQVWNVGKPSAFRMTKSSRSSASTVIVP